MKHKLKSQYSFPMGLRILIVALLLSVYTNAQVENQKSENEKRNGGLGHFCLGVQNLNLQNLNTSLSSNGYGALPLSQFTFGGSGSFVVNNFLFGGGGAWMRQSQTQNQTNSFDLNGSYGYFSFGYLLVARRRSILYPTIGIGGGNYNMTIDKDGAASDFSGQLSTPQGMSTAKAGGWMGIIQLSYERFFMGGTTEGFSIGISAGYNYSPYYWNLRVNDSNISNSPNINMNGFFASITLGGGSVIKQ